MGVRSKKGLPSDSETNSELRPGSSTRECIPLVSGWLAWAAPHPWERGRACKDAWTATTGRLPSVDESISDGVSSFKKVMLLSLISKFFFKSPFFVLIKINPLYITPYFIMFYHIITIIRLNQTNFISNFEKLSSVILPTSIKLIYYKKILKNTKIFLSIKLLHKNTYKALMIEKFA